MTFLVINPIICTIIRIMSKQTQEKADLIRAVVINEELLISNQIAVLITFLIDNGAPITPEQENEIFKSLDTHVFKIIKKHIAAKEPA